MTTFAVSLTKRVEGSQSTPAAPKVPTAGAGAKTSTGPAVAQTAAPSTSWRHVGGLHNPHTGFVSHLQQEMGANGKPTGRFAVHHLQAGAEGLHQHVSQAFMAKTNEDVGKQFKAAHQSASTSQVAHAIARGNKLPTGHNTRFHSYEGMRQAGMGQQAFAAATAHLHASTRAAGAKRIQGAVTRSANQAAARQQAAALPKMPTSTSRFSFPKGPGGEAVSTPHVTTSGQEHVGDKSGMLYGAHHHETHEFVTAHATGPGKFVVHHQQVGPLGHIVLHSSREFSDRGQALAHAAKLTGSLGGGVAKQVRSGTHPGRLNVAGWKHVGTAITGTRDTEGAAHTAFNQFAGGMKKSVKSVAPLTGAGRLYGILLVKSAGPHKYSSTQVDLAGDEAESVIALGKTIPDDELAADGREDHPHITVLYGLELSRPEPVNHAVEGSGQIRVKVGNLSLFDAPDFDVLKYDVETSQSILACRKRLSRLAHTSTHPDYHPHITVAYIKKGEGKKYCGEGPLTGQNLSFDELTFSAKDGHVYHFALAENGKSSSTEKSVLLVTMSSRPSPSRFASRDV